jgi:hypothetical protein
MSGIDRQAFLLATLAYRAGMPEPSTPHSRRDEITIQAQSDLIKSLEARLDHAPKKHYDAGGGQPKTTEPAKSLRGHQTQTGPSRGPAGRGLLQRLLRRENAADACKTFSACKPDLATVRSPADRDQRVPGRLAETRNAVCVAPPLKVLRNTE